MIPVEVLERIAAAKALWPGIVQSYIVWHPVFPREEEAVLCKVCRRRIRGMVEDPRFEYSQTLNGKTVVYKKLILGTFANYCEIRIKFDDGTSHDTGACKECANIITDEQLEAIYMADLEQWREEEEKGRGSIRWDRYGARRPVGRGGG